MWLGYSRLWGCGQLRGTGQDTGSCGSLQDIQPGQHILPACLACHEVHDVRLSIDEVEELQGQDTACEGLPTASPPLSLRKVLREKPPRHPHSLVPTSPTHLPTNVQPDTEVGLEGQLHHSQQV